MTRHRVEFKLSMPGRSSWNGGWSGEGRNYLVVRELSDEDLARLFDIAPDGVDLTKCRRIWTHRWSDGWLAQIADEVHLSFVEARSYFRRRDHLKVTGNPIRAYILSGDRVTITFPGNRTWRDAIRPATEKKESAKAKVKKAA